MNQHSITAAIICKNGELTLAKTLASLSFCDDIILLDDFSTDRTVDIAKKFHAKIITGNYANFADKRNILFQNLKTDWIFYIDADEIVSRELATEIVAIVEQNTTAAYRINRENYFLGTKMYPDQVDRLFHRAILKKWVGAVHESPLVNCDFKSLTGTILHFTHTNIFSMLEKTNHWSDIEADLRIKSHHPPVAWWRLIRIALSESWHQFINKKLYKYGRAGSFEGYFQIVDKLIVYTKLWELQQN